MAAAVLIKNLFMFSKRKILFGVLILLVIYFSITLLFIEPHIHNRKILHLAKSTFAKHFFIAPRELDGLSKTDLVCPNLAINQKIDIQFEENSSCQQHIPSQSGCKFARNYFTYDKSKRRCDSRDTLEICKFYKNDVRCSYKACGEDFTYPVYMHIFDVEDGTVKPIKESASLTDSEVLYNLMKYAKMTSGQGYEFIFASCDLDIKKTQLIIIDDIIKATSDVDDDIIKEKNDPTENISINFVLLDSLSRAHFYRSLKETITMFNKINLESETEILDFELFQALHGHTVENLHAFFSGFVFPENITDEERENRPLGVDLFYKFLKRNNYQTIYQDDMCYDAVWGMRLDLGNPRSWEGLRQAIKDASIDNTGLTMASCKILELFDVAHVFNTGEDEKLCFNGVAQDAYYLRKLVYEFQLRQKLFAFTSLMFSHDAYGLRTQSLDEDLATFVEKISNLENTLTILMADHGNAYTDFVYLDSEGRYEMFHPSLFMIIPKGVQKRLGESNLANLRINQKRLVTQLDLHHTIKYLVDDKHPNHGLLASISKKRTCDDLPLRQPNLCLCKGSNTPVQNTTDYIGHVEFAVGELNNIIIKSSPRKCKLLVPIGFDNVIQKQDSSNKVVTMFNIITDSGFQSKNDVDRFSVAVSSVTSGSVDTLEMKLQSHDRLSSFGNYRECSDADAKFRLCVCDIKKKKLNLEGQPHILARKTSSKYSLFSEKVAIEEERVNIGNTKLFLSIRTFKERKFDDDKNEIESELMVVSFEVFNYAKKRENYTYRVKISFGELENMKQTTNSDCSAIVSSQQIIYLCSLVRKYIVWAGSYEYKVSFEKI